MRESTQDIKLSVAEAFVTVLRAEHAVVVAQTNIASLEAHALDVEQKYGPGRHDDRTGTGSHDVPVGGLDTSRSDASVDECADDDFAVTLFYRCRLRILLKGAGIELIWESLLGIFILGSVNFGLGLWRFRRQFG